MKKPTLSKKVVVVLCLLLSLTSVSQNFVQPTLDKNFELKGDMLLIGNSVLGKNNSPLNDLSNNETVSMTNIDIDSDLTTFNSSSADLKVPVPGSCFRIVYAGLYWGAILQSGSRANIGKVKLKVPGSTTYTNIDGTIIYDANAAPIAPDSNKPYACFADVTSLLTGLTTVEGTYTAANIVTSTGLNGTTGLSAGWSLFVVYEDPKTTTKSISTFNGFSALYDGKTLDIPINGFLTAPSGNINIKYGFASLNGDKAANGSKVEISNGQANGSALVTPVRTSNGFFNSAITDVNGYLTTRNPNGTNSLGYDTGIEQMLNVNKSTVDHNATTAQITLQVAKGLANPVFSFFNAFEVDVIAPDIQMTKVVKDALDNDIGGSNVSLGDNLFYEIAYQNIGNDKVTAMTIKDVLPNNVIFNYPDDLYLSNSGGVTVKSYDATTRTIIFNVPDTSVEVGDPIFKIRLKVQVVADCNALSDACSNLIRNQAFASYRGVINTKPIVEEGSFASTVCNFGAGTSTNFLVGIDNCSFNRRAVLCNTAVLTASDGYDSYAWSRTQGGAIIARTKTLTVNQTGTYYVTSTSNSSCKSIVEVITVVPFGNTLTNPILPYAQAPYAGSIARCPSNGVLLPNLFLCGINEIRPIHTGITDATSISWEKLNESAACPAATSTTECANEDTACSWSVVGNTPDIDISLPGQYRLKVNYGGCFSTFYFNVFQNPLDPSAVSKDITCNTKGQITVNGFPDTGYEFSLDQGGTGSYQTSNVFNNVAEGFHDVYARLINASNGCVFKVPGVYIQDRQFQVIVNTTQPLCNGVKGSVSIQANNVLPQYYFSIYQGLNEVNTVGPIDANDFTFSDLNPGVYTVRVWTVDGCDYSQDITINAPALLSANAVLTKPLTCTDGLITVTTTNGTAPMQYYVNSTTNYQISNLITVSNPLPPGGLYTIDVVDSKGCKAQTTITVVPTPAPVFTVKQTDISCYGGSNGQIQFDVTSNAGAYILSYNIDGSNTYSNNPVFSNLAPGVTYTPKLRYTLNNIDYCYDTQPDITFTAPTYALSASAGVSRLAGCGPNGEGTLRITNPSGGVAPYEYSFDNQATWTTVNSADKMPGTYTLYVRDSRGCIFAIPNIILAAQPVPPTISLSAPVYNCNGSATATATITNPGSGNYKVDYLYDGNPNTNNPPNVFVNVPSGSHTVSITYTLLSVPTYSNLLKEDFGVDSFTYTATASPDSPSPGINPAFCWERQIDATKCNGSKLFGNGEYTVTSSLRNNPYTFWWSPKDHTSANPKGRFLAVDAGAVIPNNAVLYRKTIKDIIPNRPIQVRFFATNLLTNNQPDASLTVELQDSSGRALSSSSTGGIPKTSGWVEYNRTIDPGNNTSLDFVLRLELSQVNGIDFAVDDLEVYQLPESCITKVDFPFEVPTGKAFTASVTGTKDISCKGANDGEITIAAQNFDATAGFYYSIDGGANWIKQTSSPFTIRGLSPMSYTPLLRYDALGACPLTLPAINLKEPEPLAVQANVTSLASCTTGATVTASATGGTAPYIFELRQLDGVTIVTPFNVNTDFYDVQPGAYTIFAKDANGCTSSVGAPVTILPAPSLTAEIDPASDLCFDAVNQATLIVKVTGGSMPFSYRIDNGPYQDENSFAHVAVGSHTIEVIDSNNCTSSIDNYIIAPQLLPVAAVSKNLDCSNTPDAVITVSIAGGIAPFTYTVQKGSGTISAPSAPSSNTSFTYTVSASNADSYTFVVKDALGCSATTTTTVDALLPIAVNVTPNNLSCNGANDGSVVLSATGGVGPYTYDFNGLGASRNTIYSGLKANIDYTFVVTDSNGCIESGTVRLSEPAAISGEAGIVQDYSCLQNGIIEVKNVSGGTGTRTYSIDGINFQSSPIFTNLTDGTYTITIKDDNNCSFVTPEVTIDPLNGPTDMSFTASALSCPDNKSNVTINTSPTPGNQPFTYSISPALPAGAMVTATGIDNLSPGTYKFQVTDSKGCTYEEDFTIRPLPVLKVVGTVVSNVECFGTATGAMQIVVSGATNFTYSINGADKGAGVSPINLVNLPAADYLIEIVNKDTNCSVTTNLTIAAPTAALSFTKTVIPIQCGGTNGSVVATASGGWGGFTYTLTLPNGSKVGPQQGAAFTNLTQVGDYTIEVSDANHCSESQSFTLSTPVLPVAAAASNSDLCYDTVDKATIVVKATLGNPPYQYSIDNGLNYFQSDTFANLLPGTYDLRVKDAFGCESVAQQLIINNQIKLNTLLTKELDCSASSAAVITGTIKDGSGDYKYTVSIDEGPANTPQPVIGQQFSYSIPTVASPTNYHFEISDVNGCPATSADIVVEPLSLPEIESVTESEHIYCFGEETAAITVKMVANLGAEPFTINVLNQTSGRDYGTQTSGLAAGHYLITVTDAKGCPTTKAIDIKAPEKIVVEYSHEDITCDINNLTSMGKIYIDKVTGGTKNYDYHVTGNNYDQVIRGNTGDEGAKVVFEVVDFGRYQLTVTDANGCSVAVNDITIASSPDDLDITATISATDCASGGTAVVTVAERIANTLGNGPFHFALYNGTAMTYSASNSAWHDADPGFPKQATFGGLLPGVNYTFIVHDGGSGCYYFETAEGAIPSNSTLEVVTTDVTNVRCKEATPENSGTVSIKITSIYPVDTHVKYVVYDSESIVSTGVTGEADVPANSFVEVNNISGLGFGNYIVVVTEDTGATHAGCSKASNSFNISESAVTLSLSAHSIKNASCKDTGIITAQAQNGTAPYKYQVVPVGTAVDDSKWVDTNTFAVAGSVTGIDYDVHAKDSFGCDKVVTVTMLQDPTPVVQAQLQAQCDVAEGAFVINVSVTDPGIAPYRFSINNGSFQQKPGVFSMTGLSSGDYTIELNDVNGCGNKVDVKILAPLDLSPSINSLVTCPSNTGSIKANAIGGSGNYSYSISPNAGSLSGNIFSNLPPDTYTVSVTDTSTNCTVSKTIELVAPSPINFTTSKTDVSCNGDNNGSILVTLGAGNNDPTYTYQISGPVNVGPQGSNLFTALPAGDYVVKVISGKSCELTSDVKIVEPAILKVDASSGVTAFGCAPDNTVNTATVTVIATANTGTAPYSYSIDGTNYFPGNTFSITDTTPSPLKVYIKDAHACVADGDIMITPLPKITDATLDIVSAIDCNLTGSVKINVVGGSGNFSYQQLPAGPTNNTALFDLTGPGTYYFRVNDLTTGCYFDLEPYIVLPFNTLDVKAKAQSAVSCFGDQNGSLSIDISGFAANYAYEVLNSLGTIVASGTGNAGSVNPQLVSGLSAGNYTVRVRETDSPYCSKTSNMVTIASPTAQLKLTTQTVNDNCNQDAGLIVANAQGGTAPYMYQILPALATAPTASSSGWSLSNSLNVESGDYVVYVKDTKDCPASVAVKVDLDPTPIIAAQLTNICAPAEGSFAVAVNLTTAGISPYRLSIDGSSFQTRPMPYTITNLSSGNHNIVVKDINGCGDVAGVNVSILAPLALSPTLINLPSCADNDAVVDLRATGGSGSYQYKVDNNGYVSALRFSGLSSGTHTFYVKDNLTLCEVSVQLPITTAAPVPDFTATGSQASCNGATDGTITASWTAGSNGNPPYTYSLSGTTLTGLAITRSAQASNLFKNLAAGSYTVEVSSARGCVAQRTATVTEPSTVSVQTPTVVQFNCNVDSNSTNLAKISVDNVSGGSSVYAIYEFFKNGVSVQRGSSSVYTESDLGGGSYTVLVYDNKGCQGTSAAVRIDPFVTMDHINVVVDRAIDCNNKENITVTAVDGSGTAVSGVEYTLVDRNATTNVEGGVYPLQRSSTGVFTDLGVANYIITAKTALGCVLKEVHYVSNPNTFELKIDNLVDVQCFGGANGSATISVVDQLMPDQAGPFTYVLQNPAGGTITGDSAGSTSVNLLGLSAGTYHITVSLSGIPYCSVSGAFTINQPLEELKIDKSFSPITCVSNDGSISATASGGWPGGYEFQLELGTVVVQGWSNQSEFTGLSAGNYTIKVRDSKGCSSQTQQSLVDPSPIVANLLANKTQLACFGNSDVTLTVQQPVSGGSGVYNYTLETTYADGTVVLDGPQASNVFANLGVGSYRVLVSDSWTCSTATNRVQIAEPTQIVASLVKSSVQTCNNAASLTLSASGGTAPYTYSADPNFGSGITNFAGSISINVPFATVGTSYTYYVKDANGCGVAISNAIDVIPLDPLQLNFEKDKPTINCFGDKEGEIIAEAKGGMGNYVYSLLDAAGNALPSNPTQLSPGHFSQLAAGSYIVLVSSGDCTLRKPITISEPGTPLTFTAAVSPVSCNGYGNGKLELTAQGGTGVIKFALSPDLDKFLDSGTFLNLRVGHYQAIIQDENGCNHIYDFDIVEPAPITAVVDPLSIKQELCTGDKTGAFTIAISGGNAPYSSSIDGDSFVADRVSFSGLTGGRHTVMVKDAKLCELNFEVLLNPSVSLRPEYVIVNECVNNAPGNKVTVKIDPSNNPGDVTYTLDGQGASQRSNEFYNLVAADHFIMAEHKNGCVDATQPFKIAQIDPLTISLGEGGLNEIVATVTGGSGEYQFTVNGESIGSNNKYIYFRSGDYTVTVTDSYGCSVSAMKHYEFIDIIIPPIFTPNGDGSNDSWKPSNTENYPDIKFVVYDRYGREVGVFGAGQSWDGKYSGSELPMGDYWYILKLRHLHDDRQFVGHFTLYR